jgi:hypothetical protein
LLKLGIDIGETSVGKSSAREIEGVELFGLGLRSMGTAMRF